MVVTFNSVTHMARDELFLQSHSLASLSYLVCLCVYAIKQYYNCTRANHQKNGTKHQIYTMAEQVEVKPADE